MDIKFNLFNAAATTVVVGVRLMKRPLPRHLQQQSDSEPVQPTSGHPEPVQPTSGHSESVKPTSGHFEPVQVSSSLSNTTKDSTIL